MSIAFACSDDPVTLAAGFNDPATLQIVGVSLSNGNVINSGTGSTVLACDYTVAVSLSVLEWKLRPPGTCDVTQCGRVHLELTGPGGDQPLFSGDFASEGANIDLSRYFPSGEEAQLAAGRYTLTADLIDDGGNPYHPEDGGVGSAQVSFQLDLPTNCGAADGSAGAGSAGAGGAGSVSDGGAAGLAGAAGSADSAGAAGQSTGGSSGSSGTGGSSGSSGTGGAGGIAPEAGATGA